MFFFFCSLFRRSIQCGDINNGLFLLAFVCAGRRLRGKAFYYVGGKVFCEEDFLVSNTQANTHQKHAKGKKTSGPDLDS